MSQTQLRNKQVDGALQSSANGGQFARKNSEVSIVNLDAQVPLPKGYQHVLDPVPGQTLFDGTSAPATFAEAWTQTFAPLTAAELAAGRTMRHSAQHMHRYELLSSIDLERADLGGIREISVRTVDGKDVLDVHSWSAEQPECSHEEDGYVGGNGHYYEPEFVDPESCEDLSCECFHCALEHVENHPAYFGQTTDDKTRVTLSFTLPDGIAGKAQQVFDAFNGLDALSRLRANATGKPWAILSPVGLQDAASDPEYISVTNKASEAHAVCEEYAGIMPDGRIAKTYPRSKYAEEMEELKWAIYHAENYRLPGEHPYQRSTPEQVAEHLQSRHAEHEKVIAELSLIESTLGRPVNDSVRQGALAVHSEEHRLYERGVLAGKARQDEIIESGKAASERYSALADRRNKLWLDLCGRARDGSGWPEGTLNAPTREEWRDLAKDG